MHIIGIINQTDKDISSFIKALSDTGMECVDVTECMQIMMRQLGVDGKYNRDFRASGYKLSDHYWVNLTLSSCAGPKRHIVLYNLIDKDVIEDVIKPVYIRSEKQSCDTIVLPEDEQLIREIAVQKSSQWLNE